MSAVAALEMTRELMHSFERKHEELLRKKTALEKDILDLESRIRKTPSAFFQSTVLPEWRKQLKKLELDCRETLCYANTCSVFIGENKALLNAPTSRKEFSAALAGGESWEASNARFWEQADLFIAARNEKKPESPQGSDLDWDV